MSKISEWTTVSKRDRDAYKALISLQGDETAKQLQADYWWSRTPHDIPFLRVKPVKHWENPRRQIIDYELSIKFNVKGRKRANYREWPIFVWTSMYCLGKYGFTDNSPGDNIVGIQGPSGEAEYQPMKTDDVRRWGTSLLELRRYKGTIK